MKRSAYPITLLVLLCLARPVRSATFTVDVAGDRHDVNAGDGVCSDGSDLSGSRCTLRAALEECDALPGADTILVPSEITPIYLSLGPLVCNDDNTSIMGSGSASVVDGSGNPFASHVFRLRSNGNRLCGLRIQRAHYHGILIEGSNNVIGGTAESERNIIISNGLDISVGAGVAVVGDEATNNAIVGNFVGMADDGTTPKPNSTGIRIADGSHDNLVDSNLISGNVGSGIIVTLGAHHNRIIMNTLGPDITGLSGPGNGDAGLLLADDANDNVIGGVFLTERNLISLNRGDGISIENSHRNAISGNNVGLEIFNRNSLGNAGAGVRISGGSTENMIGGSSADSVNLISGNLGDGVTISGNGTDRNRVRGNYIGLDFRGIRSRGNGWTDGYGISIGSGARDNVIGGSIAGEGNAVSGNPNGGICLFGSGTDGNVIWGNYVGLNVFGTSSVPNGTGVIIKGGASGNLIGGASVGERNLLSGNRADIFPFGCGLLISDPGTSDNVVSGNYIGLDVTGTRARRNGSSGVIMAYGASHNIVGGFSEAEQNVISGNGAGDFVAGLARGVHLFGPGTAYNRIVGNRIGLAASGDARVENIGHGIGIFAGAADNFIGGDSPNAGNVVALNGGHGIVISDAGTNRNLIRYNNTYDNDSLGIAVVNGAQGGIAPPVVSSASTELVMGYGAGAGGQVDVYKVRVDPSGRGEGISLVGSGSADQDGSFTIGVAGLVQGDTVSVVTIDAVNNSSEFSVNHSVNAMTSVDDDIREIPSSYELAQNRPNPFNPSTEIQFSLPVTGQVDLSVYNLLGQKVITLLRQSFPAGSHTITWHGVDEAGSSVTSGVYFVRFVSGEYRASRKMVLIR